MRSVTPLNTPPNNLLNNQSNDPLTRREAFTLVELLVVITIIIVLMGLLFPVAGGAMRQAKKTEAMTQAQSIAAALKGYFTEYGRYPIEPNPTSDEEVTGDDLKVLYKVLIASPRDDSDVQDLNPRLIVFLEARDAKNGKSGLDEDKVYRDPWKQPFQVVIDANYDNEITSLPAPFNGDFTSSKPLRQSVAVFSLGDPDDPKKVVKDRAVATWQ